VAGNDTREIANAWIYMQNGLWVRKSYR